MFKQIIIPLDGSPLAETALHQAQELARMADASIQLVRVVDFTSLENAGPVGLALAYVPHDDVLDVEHEEAQRYLESVAAELRGDGFAVSTAVYRGRASRVLSQVVGADDVIVMASHGRGGLTRWFLGSVAEDLLRHARAPVMLVRAGQLPARESLPLPTTARAT